MGIWSTDYIPRGTRFGPLVGKRYAKDEVPKTANRKYFWRVSVDTGGLGLVFRGGSETVRWWRVDCLKRGKKMVHIW